MDFKKNTKIFAEVQPMISKVSKIVVDRLLHDCTLAWLQPHIAGKDYRVVILSTSEPTNADGSARDLTKSICDPFVFNTVISRARSLIVCIGNPYVLLRKEQHMVGRYGEKAKCWSNFLKLCFDNGTFSVGTSVESTLSLIHI